MINQAIAGIAKSRRSKVTRSVAELELERAKSAMDQFIYSCSHTMRGPLKSISGLVYLMKNSEPGDETDPKFCLQSIDNIVTKMESILNDLEKFLNHSKQEMIHSSIQVQDVVHEILEEFGVVVAEKKISVNIAVQQNTALYVDRNRFRSLLFQLISNAIQYQDDGKAKREVNITIKVYATDCMIQIRDNGIGMNEKTLSNIFHLFYRGSEKSAGAGIGLYITRDIISNLGGTISVRSKMGEGSRFSCSIPNFSATT